MGCVAGAVPAVGLGGLRRAVLSRYLCPATLGRVTEGWHDDVVNRSALPPGFVVEVDQRARVLGAGTALLGGSPARLLRLSPTALAMLAGRRVKVADAPSGQLARILLDTSIAHPRPTGGSPVSEVTVVTPVRDNISGLRRLLKALHGMRVIVVDDGSVIPVELSGLADESDGLRVVRHRSSRGPAAARNTGLAACATELVAFLDSDVVPQPDWLKALLGHFDDPLVAVAAPRIIGLAQGGNLLARYENVRSSLDLGAREAPVLPYGTVSYVPSAAMLCRRRALVELGGFDEALNCGEDVDLCWRLFDSGARLRYEPSALVAHDHRVETRQWLARRGFYGTSAAPLAARHPDKIAPLQLPAATLAAWLLALTGQPVGWAASIAIAAWVSSRISGALRGAVGGCDVALIAAEGFAGSGLQLASAVCRHYWPVTLLAGLVSRRCRRIALVAAIVEGIVDWASRRRNCKDRPIGLLPYLGLKRLDDIAYGAGVWIGVLRERELGALKPQIRMPSSASGAVLHRVAAPET
jgi:mycofactocin system glycosyltransferase